MLPITANIVLVLVMGSFFRAMFFRRTSVVSERMIIQMKLRNEIDTPEKQA